MSAHRPPRRRRVFAVFVTDPEAEEMGMRKATPWSTDRVRAAQVRRARLVCGQPAEVRSRWLPGSGNPS